MMSSSTSKRKRHWPWNVSDEQQHIFTLISCLMPSIWSWWWCTTRHDHKVNFIPEKKATTAAARTPTRGPCVPYCKMWREKTRTYPAYYVYKFLSSYVVVATIKEIPARLVSRKGSWLKWTTDKVGPPLSYILCTQEWFWKMGITGKKGAFQIYEYLDVNPSRQLLKGKRL